VTDYLGPGQATAIDISYKAQKLMNKSIEVILQWVPSHIDIEGNEKADKAAKEVAGKLIWPETETERYNLFSYIIRKIKA
jgi:ribonuclease HI